MPTPHGSRGGMAFSADEVRVLRRALAQALHPAIPVHLQGPDRTAFAGPGVELWAEDVQDALRLTEAIDEAVQEGGRLRAFLLADLARYRAALPGSAAGYLERLEEAVSDGYLPGPEDLTALRGLSRQPCGHGERARRSRLAGRCHALAEAAVRERLALTAGQPRHLVAVPSPAAPPSSLPTPVGGRIPMSSTDSRPEQPAAEKNPPRPHRMPTPAELFGRRPKPPAHPAPPADEAPEEIELATGTG
ncbi:hypothetical protein [Kitasatospora sp. SUK 42]|uniref:hypothetical protein n=1 Tax=Kitasatospora sp. SUK 42 TaxID=1588882 RepID=UPI0018CA6A64|nr:hypothetical protein [Kitasatospora sp. SUK 42]MBV2154612.1 hypothetical protein [Kitasatospora sp. SUK 42]